MKMENEKRSFEDLLRDSPKAPAAGTISLVGTVEQSKDEGKFVLMLGNGSSVTLETSMVKSYAVLGESVGQKIVRVDIDREKVLVMDPIPVPWLNREPVPLPWERGGSGNVPFSLAAPEQASADFRILPISGPERTPFNSDYYQSAQTGPPDLYVSKSRFDAYSAV